MPAPDTLAQLSVANKRRLAAAHAHTARAELREASKILDGLGTTAHQNSLAAMIACEDVMDAILAANALDVELAGIERASFRDERGIQEPGL